MKLALHIIAKNEVEEVGAIILEYEKHFDEIVIAADQRLEEFQELSSHYKKVKVFPYEWIKDFSHKRNFLVDKTESEYYFRLDCDDEIRGADKIRECFDYVVSNNIDVLYVPYIYSSDEDGNCNAEHWRETIIKKSPNHYWMKSVHENIHIEDQSKFRGHRSDTIKLFHNITPEHAEESGKRNLDILLEEFNRDKNNTDPRTIAYIGRMLVGMGQWLSASKFLELLIAKSGWEDDKYFAWVDLSRCRYHLNDLEQAIACCYEALSIKTDFPDAYLTLCELYLCKKDYDKALHWGLIGVSKPKPKTMFVLDPTVYTYRAVMNIAMAYFGKGDFENAKKSFDAAYEMAPSNEFISSKKDLFKEAYENEEYIKRLMWLLFYTRNKDESKLQSLVNAVPKNLLQDERVQSIRHQILPAKTWGERDIVIFCGRSWEEWGAPSIINGIGGSEEAVIYLSRELTKLGYKVTVFNNCGDFEGDFEGVTYKQFYEFNYRDTFSHLIAWRENIFSKVNIAAKNKIVWLHDVPLTVQFPENYGFDKVIVLSEYHKSLVKECAPHIPDSKILVSSNGINLKDFSDQNIIRNPKRLIYTSSYDRGLEHILRMWPDVLKEVPDAELHIFYGWNLYDKMVDVGVRSEEFKKMMLQLMNQKGVFEHGRVGHKQLIKEFYKSGVYAYSSHFEEISCISAMKAQACGCVPVVTNYAALKETVKDGIIIEGKSGIPDVDKRYSEALIGILKDEKRQEEIRSSVLNHKSQFGWEKVAQQWNDNLFR